MLTISSCAASGGSEMPSSAEAFSSRICGWNGLIRYSSARVFSFLCFSKLSGVALAEVRMTGMSLS